MNFGNFHLQELLFAGILLNEARLGRNGYFRSSAKELRSGKSVIFMVE